MKKHLIFDLDGTLIDSAPSILEGYDQAFKTTDTPLQMPLTSDVIGPPLIESLKMLSGRDDDALLQALATAFKQHYDSTGYLKSVVFEGVSDLLQQLHDAGYQLYIATNKRLFPTEKIIHHLQWDVFFSGVFALDYFQPALRCKADMVGRIVQDLALPIDECLYIGDRLEDGEAADAHQMDFVLVTWGYAADASLKKPHWQSCTAVNDLPTLIADTQDKHA
ncbi:MAG: HAD family hydrolase [Methylophilus sp.]|uniref:HAD family hydrolase n=1 Tax=Methylophilus sp. TaxID=29541 RepID=UPI003F9F483B